MRAAGSDKPYRVVAGTVILRVRLTPKSSRDQVEGTMDTAEGPALKARVRAVPEDGKANAALAALVADWLDVAGGRVAVVGGQTSRVKSLAISGDAIAVAAALDARLQ